MNVFTFSGRVGQEPELKSTQSGEKVLGFSIANDVGFGDRKKTQWIECSYWGKRAESVSRYIKKGDKIAVSGELQLIEFQRRDGTPGSKLAVRVNDLDLPSREGGSQESGSGGGTPNRRYGGGSSGSGNAEPRGGAGGRGGGKPVFDDDLDDQIPF